MHRPLLRPILAAAIAAALLGCTDAGPAHAAGDAPPPSPRARVSIAPVELIEAGSEPREVLRLDPTDAPAPRRLVYEEVSEMTRDDEEQAVARPKVTYRFTATASPADADDRIALSLDLAEPLWTVPADVAADRAEALVRSTAGFDDVVIDIDLGTNGMVKVVAARGAETLSPQGRLQLGTFEPRLRNLMPQFPTEAVGPGARWMVRTELSQFGITMDQVTTFELVRREPERLVLKVLVEQTARGDAVQVPGFGVGKLESFEGGAEGEIEVRRDGVLPVAAQMESFNRMQFSFDLPADAAPSHPRRLSNDTTMLLRLETPE